MAKRAVEHRRRRAEAMAGSWPSTPWDVSLGVPRGYLGGCRPGWGMICHSVQALRFRVSVPLLASSAFDSRWPWNGRFRRRYHAGGLEWSSQRSLWRRLFLASVWWRGRPSAWFAQSAFTRKNLLVSGSSTGSNPFIQIIIINRYFLGKELCIL